MLLFFYIRKSRVLGDPDDPAFLSHQREDLLRLADREGRQVTPDRLHEEVGSGETIADRPVFDRLLSSIERLPRDVGGVLYCTEVSRLTRDSHADAGRIIAALSRADIHVHTPNRRYNLRSPEDIFLFDLETVFANREFQQAKERLRRGQREARRKGRIPNGIAPLGYRYSLEGKTLIEDPERFPILVSCCTEALATPVWRLAEKYGVPENCLLRALRNPTICGYPARRYGPKNQEKPHRKEYVPIAREQWLWPEVQNTTYTHACTRDDWEMLQAALDARRDRRARIHQGQGWCRDRVQFAGDPGPVRLGSYAVTRTREGNVMCLTYERSRPLGATHLFVPRQTVHDAVLPPLLARLSDPKVMAWGEAIIAEDLPKIASEREEQRTELRRQLGQLRSRYQDAVDMEMDTDDPNHRHSLSVRRLRLQERLGKMEKELQSLEAKGEQRQVARLFRCFADITPDRLRQWWDDTERTDGFFLRELLNACVRLIEVEVEPTRPPRPHRREVRRIDWQPWLNNS